MCSGTNCGPEEMYSVPVSGGVLSSVNKFSNSCRLVIVLFFALLLLQVILEARRLDAKIWNGWMEDLRYVHAKHQWGGVSRLYCILCCPGLLCQMACCVLGVPMAESTFCYGPYHAALQRWLDQVRVRIIRAQPPVLGTVAPCCRTSAMVITHYLVLPEG